MNLCVNARDAMRNGGELAIGTENVSIDVEAARKRPAFVPGNYAALVVSDTGTGMTKEVQAHLFEPFFTTKESGRGTGLGLSTVYGIVKQSGGYIWVDSELGRGSSFSLYFPAVDAPLTTTITPRDRRWPRGRVRLILLVEDDEALRESISTYLDSAWIQSAGGIEWSPSTAHREPACRIDSRAHNGHHSAKTEWRRTRSGGRQNVSTGGNSLHVWLH